MHPLNTLPIVVILLGPPGCGKGTQAKKLAIEYSFPQISTGDLFRHQISEQTTLGLKAKEFIQAGHLVPDELVLDMVFDRISQPDCQKGYLLDGFPRTVSQANTLFDYLNHRAKVIVISLQVEDETIVQRTVNRLVCQDCGAIYNSKSLPPKKEGQCDACKGCVYKRNDDREDVIRERLKVYHTLTQPLIHYYQEKGLLTSLQANDSAENIYQQICDELDQYLS